MNEHIKELAEQAGADVWGDQVSASQYFDIEKFAELIIKECIEQCADDSDSKDDWDKGVRWAANQIKTHFGVE